MKQRDMTSLSDITGLLLDSSPTSFNTKSAYEAGLVNDVIIMNKTDVNGFIQDRTFTNMFPPVCIKSHWDPELLANRHILPVGRGGALPVDPRPYTRICSMYHTTAPEDLNENKMKRAKLGLANLSGGAAGRNAPFEVYANNINIESDILLNKPQDKCDDNKWRPTADSDLYNNKSSPPKNISDTFSELSRPLATIVSKTPYKCRADADSLAWDRSPRLFNNLTREDRASGNTQRASEGLLAKKTLISGKTSDVPRVWPSRSVVFYVGADPVDDILNQLCQAIVSRGYEVTVFSKEKTAMNAGVSYHNIDEFVPNDVYSTIVLWGTSKLLDNYQHRPNAKAIVLSIDKDEDICQRPIKESADKIIVKSAFHRSLYNCYSWSKFEIIANGLPVNMFIENQGERREPFRVLVTEYSLPLVKFIHDGWMRIYNTYPGAELHVWESSGDSKKHIFPHIQTTKGVVLHGVATLQDLVRERFKSSVHLYLEDKDVVSCDKLRFSALAGCIPIMPSRGVYTELGGVNVEGDVNDSAVLEEYAKAVSAVLKDKVYSSGLRVRLQKDANLKGWNATADRWLTIIEGIKERNANHKN
jgi:hypothetical protein